MPAVYTLYNERAQRMDTQVLPIPILGMDALAAWVRDQHGASVTLWHGDIKVAWHFRFYGDVCTIFTYNPERDMTPTKRIHMGLAPRWVFDITDDLPCETHLVQAEPYGTTRIQHRWIRLEPVTGYGQIIGRNVTLNAALVLLSSGRAVVVDRAECYPVASKQQVDAQPA